MAGDSEQFNAVLFNLLSAENEIRSKAEHVYNEIPAENRIMLLLNAIGSGGQNDEVAQLAAVLLRRVLYNEFEGSFPKLSPEAQTLVKSQLLILIQHDVSPNLRKKICDAVAELARGLIDDDGNNHWPEFLKFLFDSANSCNAVLKEASLLLFASVPGIFGNQQSRYLDVIHQMLFQSLSDQSSPKVQYAAIKAICSFIVTHDKETSIHKRFSDCLSPLLQTLNYALENDEEEAETILKHIVDIGETCPQFLRSQLDGLFQICLKILSNENVNDACKHMGLEVIVTLSETAPAMVRKLGTKHISVLVPLVFKMLIDLDEDENWNSADENIDEDNDSNPVVAESSFDRLACALGGKTMLPFVMSCLPDMLNSGDWKQRHAGLMCISAVGEGCHKQMEVVLPQIVDGIMPFLQDPHPRVRYAACNALGQMATDFAPLFEKKFHDKVIPGLLQLLTDPSSPRVQAHAGAALVNFFEDCSKQILSPYLNSIVEKLESVLNSKFKELIEKGNKLVLEQVVVTLASVADSAEEKFTNYYDRFMPCLKYIIQNANSPELRMLRGKTIECVSLIGLAVGREKFIADASDVMDLLLKTQSDGSTISEDDPQLSYMISAWARICKILGKSFEPYLPYVMGPVMKAAALKPEIAVLDTDDMKVVEGSDDWEFVSLGEQNFGIRTAGLEEKATACQMLVCYAKELKEGFAPYVEDVVKMMVPMLKFYFHDGVRAAAAESLPHLLECARIRGEMYIVEMWAYILPELLHAIDSEPEKEVLSEHMHAFSQCIEVLGGRCLTHENMITLIKVLDKNLKEHFERAQERQEKRKDEDYDEVLEETLMEEDDEDVYLLCKITDILHALFAVYKNDFFPYFDMLLEHFVRLLQPDRPWPDRQWALCAFDDVIEHGGPACAKYQQYFLQPMLAGLCDKSPEVRQAAAYGVGILGQFGGPGFAKVCSDGIPLLIQMINGPHSRDPENANATENAIAAVTKIMAYNNSSVSMEELIPVWFSWLPVWEDEDEAPHVYNFLCALMEQNNPILLGNNNCNLPRVVSIISEAFRREAIDAKSEVGKRVISLMKLIQSNRDIFALCLSQLLPEQQEALHSALSVQ